MDVESAFWVLVRLNKGILEPGFFAGKSFAMNGFFVECGVVESLVQDIVPAKSPDMVFSRQDFVNCMAI
jgi:hypothetical protein